MSRLADLEHAIRMERRFDRYADHYLHRATREDDFGRLYGRDALRDAAIAELAEEGVGPVEIVHDLGGMIVFETAGGWRAHRWADDEGALIVRETLIRDGSARARALGRDAATEAARLAAAHPVHAPLGELRAGAGQLSTAPHAVLPHDFPAAAHAYADGMHRAWNGRALGDGHAVPFRGPDGATDRIAFMIDLFTRLPDLVVLFERGLVSDAAIALRWRLHGHGDGRRVRAIGSTVLTLAGGQVTGEDTMLDLLALSAQRNRPQITY